MSIVSNDFQASLICSSSGDTFPSTQSSGSHLTTGSVPLSIAKDAVNSTELSSARLDKCIDEVIPTDTVCQEASADIPGQNTVSSSSPDDPDDLESGFVFVSALTFVETQTPSRRRNSILQSLNFTSKIPRRLSLSLSPKSKSKYTARVVDTESPTKTHKERSPPSKLDSKENSGKKRTTANVATLPKSPTTRRKDPLPVTTAPSQSTNTSTPKPINKISTPRCPNTENNGTIPPSSTRIKATNTKPSTRIAPSAPISILKTTSRHPRTATDPAQSRKPVPNPSAIPLTKEIEKVCHRSRPPVQHFRPPPPVPKAKGKENIRCTKHVARNQVKVAETQKGNTTRTRS
ncbi:hypothetical protein FB446DRAFT_739198 [Lentinula raphanica]|nr:hypothetical protein FB446DRAFT_739198 [Lentinula raphanica]